MLAIYISSAHRRRGLGRVLVSELLNIAKKQKFKNVIGNSLFFFTFFSLTTCVLYIYIYGYLINKKQKCYYISYIYACIVYISSANTASIRLFESFKFQYVGKMDYWAYNFNQFIDGLTFQYIIEETKVINQERPTFEPFESESYKFNQ